MNVGTWYSLWRAADAEKRNTFSTNGHEKHERRKNQIVSHGERWERREDKSIFNTKDAKGHEDKIEVSGEIDTIRQWRRNTICHEPRERKRRKIVIRGKLRREKES